GRERPGTRRTVTYVGRARPVVAGGVSARLSGVPSDDGRVTQRPLRVVRFRGVGMPRPRVLPGVPGHGQGRDGPARGSASDGSQAIYTWATAVDPGHRRAAPAC